MNGERVCLGDRLPDKFKHKNWSFICVYTLPYKSFAFASSQIFKHLQIVWLAICWEIVKGIKSTIWVEEKISFVYLTEREKASSIDNHLPCFCCCCYSYDDDDDADNL